MGFGFFPTPLLDESRVRIVNVHVGMYIGLTPFYFLTFNYLGSGLVLNVGYIVFDFGDFPQEFSGLFSQVLL